MLASARGLLRLSRAAGARQACGASASSWRGFATDDGLTGQDTHDDFKPQMKAEPAASVADLIKQDLASHDVFVYMKGEPEAPMCGFSNMACRILDAYCVDYGSRNVLADPELREGIKKFSQWPTIPQIFVKGELVGGSDLLMEMHEKGELEGVLKGQQ